MKQSKYNWTCSVYFGDVITATRALTCMNKINICGSDIDIKFSFKKHFAESNEVGVKLWVGGIDPAVPTLFLKKLFEDYGLVLISRLVPKGCAFISFLNEEYAERAMSEFQALEVRGNHLTLKYPSKSYKEKNKSSDGWTFPLNTGGMFGNEGWGSDGYNDWFGGGQQYWQGSGYSGQWGNDGSATGDETELSYNPIGNVLLRLSRAKVNNEDDSSLSMSIIAQLTKYLKEYKKSVGEVQISNCFGIAEDKIITAQEIKTRGKIPQRKSPSQNGPSISSISAIAKKAKKKKKKVSTGLDEGFKNLS